MLFSHPEGLYTISYDSERRLVREVPVGLWTKEEYLEYHNNLVNILGPLVCNEPWAILSDLRKYKISDLGDALAIHTEWLANNNLKYGAILCDSPIVKLQVNRAIGNKFEQRAFLTEEEAEEWLKSKGF